ncbi:MerR family transcriptional regulator [Lactococcus hircilactis]|uniref:MerR family transcriptional regulator n=1 Tax=Lactococcus hircilactis TaxID=1494462 RepID=A0A7X2D028_9LACT|nr:MerR family transcriptional regulator [Lactococcus hircilactis]MQW39309.1 MerR family transcriptional regulator [Lactococcus hircilactis]
MKIKDVTLKTGLSANAIRYYEKEHLITIARNQSGYREFSTANLERLRLITQLRAAGCGIDFLRHYCALLDDDENHDKEQKQLLADEAIVARQRLQSLADAVDFLDWKVSVYYDRVKHLGDASKNKDK